jgi:sphingomyelin phosphodiesterase acid-like 3
MAQEHPSAASTIPVLMLSDIHFDPFRDPAKVAKLAAAPVAGWEAILKAPDSADQAASFQALQAACGSAKGLDTPETLFDASLKSERTSAAGAKFVTITGDLLVHQFDCRYKTLMKSETGYAEFAEKTASYVIQRVETEFPAAAVYVALGNNDSACGDYALDMHDQFLAGTSKAVIDGLRGASADEAAQAKADYETGGYFSVSLHAPMQKARLLVIDDMYLSKKWATCGKKNDKADPAAVLAWLKTRLNAAGLAGEKVWVMGHIPPGIDVYATLKKGRTCDANGAESFLAPVAKESLGDVLAAHADVITLGLFGHTHMDEMKLLPSTSGTGGVAIKGVASISPVDGNMPSFTVAMIDPAAALMNDYSVYVAPNKSGVGGPWTKEYSFDEAYSQKVYSAASLKEVVAGFRADPQGEKKASQSYEIYFDPMFPIPILVLGWPQYVCGIDHISEADFKACACAAKP